MQRRIAVRGIFIHQGKLLCVKLKPYKGAIRGDFWCVIGGGVDEGEALVPALKREIIEETAIPPIIGNLLYIQQYKHADKEHIEFFFNILNPGDYLHVDLTKTSHGHDEIEVIEYIVPREHNVLPKFLTEVNLSQISLHNPTKIFDYM